MEAKTLVAKPLATELKSGCKFATEISVAKSVAENLVTKFRNQISKQNFGG